MRTRAAGELATDRRLALAIGAGSALTLAALFWPAALRRMYVYGDLGAFTLPMRLFLAENLNRGVTPLWMPNLFCGFYAHGDGNIGIFHPLRWLLYRFLPFPEAFNLECLIPYPLALIGTALFLRRLSLPASAAIFGGASFAFSGYMTARLTHLGTIAVLAHLGWLLLAIDILVREEGRRRHHAWLAIALVTGSQFLVGYPAAIAYCWLAAAPYAVVVASRERRPWRLAAVAAALAVGVAVGGIQVLPTWEHIGDSVRAQASVAALTEQSLHPLNLLSIVNPWMFRHRLFFDQDYNPIEQTIYLGAVAPIAMVWVFARRRQLDHLRPIAVGLLVFSGLALILALGKYTGVYEHLLAIPIARLLRAPARYSIAVYFAAAVCTAIAFADLQSRDATGTARPTRWIWLVPAASWIVAAAAMGIRDPEGSAFAHQIAGPLPILVGPITITLAAVLFAAAARGRAAALHGLVVLALADQAAYAAALWWLEPPLGLAEYRASVPRPDAPPALRVATERDWGWLSWGHWWASTRTVVHDGRLVSGYAGIIPSKRLDYTTRAAQRIAGAAWIRGLGPRRARLPGPLPRARLVTAARRSKRPAADLETIDVATAALVEDPVDLDSGPAGTAEIRDERPGALSISADAPTRQLLVLAESYHPGWRAVVDGAPARVLRVNGDFMGVVVPPGSHTLDFSFAPRSFALGCWTSGAGIAIVAAVALARFTRHTHA